MPFLWCDQYDMLRPVFTLPQQNKFLSAFSYGKLQQPITDPDKNDVDR